MIVSLLSVLFFVILLYLLISSLRRNKCCTRAQFSIRNIILFLTAIFSLGKQAQPSINNHNLDVALHYLIYMDNVVVYSLVFMDVTKFLVFFLTCYYFSSQAIDFLPHAQKWLLGLKGYLICGLCIQLFTALWYIIGSYQDF